MTTEQALAELFRIRDAFRHDIPDQVESQEALTMAIKALAAQAALDELQLPSEVARSDGYMEYSGLPPTALLPGSVGDDSAMLSEDGQRHRDRLQGGRAAHI